MHTHSERRRRWRQQLLSREVTEAWPSSISSSSSRAARPGDVATSPVRTSRRVSSPADKATGSACVYTSKRRRLPCTALYARTARRPTPVRIPFHRDRVTAGADRLSYIQHVLSSSLLLLLCYSPFCILYVYKIYIYIYIYNSTFFYTRTVCDPPERSLSFGPNSIGFSFLFLSIPERVSVAIVLGVRKLRP